VLWEGYISILISSHERIKEEDDELIWSMNPIRSSYSPNLGYKVIYEGVVNEELIWW
jgi:hypothetical protein